MNPPFDDAHNACTPDPFYNFIAAKLTEASSHKRRGSMDIIKEFGMLMQVPAPTYDIRVQIGHAIDNGHVTPLMT
ncbi:hypothetical protein MesoLj131b_72850 (plasmid) [Mesorhizobium sp. 131-2-5]|nr:hypothetical protein MesoLj131b_72850 [Mesorhizobium sp. 131-2-5]